MPAAGADDSGRVEFAVRPADGARRQAEVSGKLPDGGQARAGRQNAAGGHGRDLSSDLLVRRQRGLQVDGENHDVSPGARQRRGSWERRHAARVTSAATKTAIEASWSHDVR